MANIAKSCFCTNLKAPDVMELPRIQFAKNTLISAYSIMLLVGLFVLAYKGYDEGYAVNNPWVVGDWLINYHGGFVRRGLFGEFATLFGDPKLVVLISQIALYGVIYSFFYAALSARGFPLVFVFISLTPLFFMFPLLDPQGGYRKEILGLAVLAVNCWAKLAMAEPQRRWSFILTLALFPVLILVHELLVLFLPIVLLMALDLRYSRIQWLTIVLCCTASAAIFYHVVSSEVTSAQQIQQICAPLQGFCRGDINDNGAITWLQFSSDYGHRVVEHYQLNAQVMSRYAVSVLLMLPLLYLIRQPLLRGLRAPLAKLLFAVFSLGLLLLHSIAIDYGRFIHIWFSAAVFIALANARRSDEGRFIALSPVSILLILLYLPFWYLDHMATATLF